MPDLDAAPEGFRARVRVAGDGCWLWTGSTMKHGYGQHFPDAATSHGRRNWLAHRWSYTHFVGPIPDGLQIDHVCRVRSCVNPEHLEPVTAQENQRRMGAALTHCRRAGHEYTAENTMLSASGARSCRECHRESDRSRRASNPDDARRRQREARAKDPERFRAVDKAWADRNRERINAAARARRARLAEERPARRPAEKCGKGHVYADEDFRDNGTRVCRECAKEHSRRQHALVTRAAGLLGLTRKEYAAIHGWSARTATLVIARGEAA